MNASPVQSNPGIENEPGYGQLFAILFRRKFWLLTVLIGAIGLGALYTMRQQPTYLSSMQLLVEPIYQGKKSTTDEFTDTSVQIDSATQINLLQSSSLLRRAMKLVQTDYPLEMDPNDPGNVAAFKGSLSVAQVASSDGKKNNSSATKIFQVSYSSNNPEKTKKVLEALKQVYLDYNLEQQRIRLARGLAFINNQLPEIQEKVKESESALEQFRISQELLDPEAQGKAQADALFRIQQEQQTNRIQIRELQSRYSSLQQQLALSPGQAVTISRLSQSPRYQALLNEIQKTELALEQQRLRFNDGTPFVQQLAEQRQRQLNLLQLEAGRVLGQSVPVGGDRLLSSGQFGGLDQSLVNQLVDTQVNLQTAEARYQSLASAERQLRGELKRFPGLLAQYGRLQPEIELNRETLKQLLKAQQDLGLEIARGGFDWQVVEEPQYGYKTGPNLMRNLMLGAVAGLLLGGLAAFAREAADDTVHHADELKQQSAVPLLGTIPEFLMVGPEDEEQPLLSMPFRKQKTRYSSISQILQWRPFREALDLLYQNIQLFTSGQLIKSLVVTSPLADNNNAILMLGLAISAARLHQRVLVVDADLRRPSLHKLLNLPNEQGLSSLLASNATIPTQIETRTSNLRSNISVVTAGPPPSDPAKLLSSNRMREIIAAFEQAYDLVLIHTPPVLGLVDAMLTASSCSGVIMIGHLGRISRTDLSRASTTLSKLNVIGVVASGAVDTTSSQVHYQLQTS